MAAMKKAMKVAMKAMKAMKAKAMKKAMKKAAAPAAAAPAMKKAMKAMKNTEEMRACAVHSRRRSLGAHVQPAFETHLQLRHIDSCQPQFA
ncbi:unnamed protein product [Polarella glacialis]|uniref:Uncharacterized protein n=1 Tax=Polarella glacialis TaxID=89957 RepID=A0A813LR35_POLGL|nr:unnamed protein product [Polarella glacialis]